MLQSELLNKILNLDHGFITRKTEERVRDDWESRISMAKQVHGTDLLWLNKKEFKQRNGDALATEAGNLPIAIQTADCTPVAVVPIDSEGKAIAALLIHAGWRGTAGRIVERTVNEFIQRLDLDRIAQTYAAIGPCISKEAFEVEQDVVDAFPHIKPEPKGMVNGRQKFHFDLESENARQFHHIATKLGLEFQLDRLQLCTHNDPETFPSYRRDGSTGERIISFIELSK